MATTDTEYGRIRFEKSPEALADFFGLFSVGEEIDEDGDLIVEMKDETARPGERPSVTTYLPREEIVALRDHLTALLGDEKKKKKDEPAEKASPFSWSSTPFLYAPPTLDERVDAVPFDVVARLIERLKEASA